MSSYPGPFRGPPLPHREGEQRSIAEVIENIEKDLLSELSRLREKQETIARLVSEARHQASVEDASQEEPCQSVGEESRSEPGNGSHSCPNESDPTPSPRPNPWGSPLPEMLKELHDTLVDLQCDTTNLISKHCATIVKAQWMQDRKNQQVTFPQFGRFPYEIRALIWKLAVREAYHLMKRPDASSVDALARTCSESRAIRLSMCSGPVCVCEKEGIDCDCARRRTLFVRDKRALVIHTDTSLDDVPWITPWLTAARHVLLVMRHAPPMRGNLNDHDALHEECAGLWDLPPPALRGKVINVAFHWPVTRVHWIWGSPSLIRKLFGTEKKFLLDLSDLSEVQRVASILRQMKSSATSHDIGCVFPIPYRWAINGILQMADNWGPMATMGWWHAPETGWKSRLEDRMVAHLAFWIPIIGKIDGHNYEEAAEEAAKQVFTELGIHFRPVHLFHFDGPPDEGMSDPPRGPVVENPHRHRVPVASSGWPLVVATDLRQAGESGRNAADT